MAVTVGIKAIGTKWQTGNAASPEVFTDVADIVNLEVGDLERTLIDATHLLSDANFREFIVGPKDAGAVEVEYHYAPTNATHKFSGGILGLWDSGVVRNTKVIWPSTPTVTWTLKVISVRSRYIANFAEILAARGSFKITGQPTLL